MFPFSFPVEGGNVGYSIVGSFECDPTTILGATVKGKKIHEQVNQQRNVLRLLLRTP